MGRPALLLPCLSHSPFNVFHPECPRPESHSIDSVPSHLPPLHCTVRPSLRIPIAKNHEGRRGNSSPNSSSTPPPFNKSPLPASGSVMLWASLKELCNQLRRLPPLLETGIGYQPGDKYLVWDKGINISLKLDLSEGNSYFSNCYFHVNGMDFTSSYYLPTS